MDLLILKTIAAEPLHGWGISKRIQVLSGDVSPSPGSLYPALHRLEHQGWIREPDLSDLGAPRSSMRSPGKAAADDAS